jgi:hypothetical protein
MLEIARPSCRVVWASDASSFAEDAETCYVDSWGKKDILNLYSLFFAK